MLAEQSVYGKLCWDIKMKILLTFDYELFFGEVTGGVNACMIKPTNYLLEILDMFEIKATFYVDVGYLVRCREMGEDLGSYAAVVRQLHDLQSKGHDLQLHIHPHWEDAEYSYERWDFSNIRYRLHQFERKAVGDIIGRYVEALVELTGLIPIAYRAGGWCIQPFEYMADELFDIGIRVDSTVFPQGRNLSDIQGFDFREVPEKTSWTFDDDPTAFVKDGRFWELPISSIRVSPMFYWKFVLAKKFRKGKHRPYGDGKSIPLSRRQIFNLLTKNSYSVVSMDGYKAHLLEVSRSKYTCRYGSNAEMVLIGHPKAATKFSINQVRKFLEKHADEDRFLTTSQWYNEKKREVIGVNPE